VDAVAGLLADEPRRQAMGAAGRELAQDRYSWDGIGARLLEIYESVSGRSPARAAALP
jgi:glycosyltransferase involved in cell wall biosynthesis